MTKKIKIKRGLEAALPTLQEGEPGFTTDSKKLFVGSDAGNIEIGGVGGGGDVASLIADLQDGKIIVGKATKDASGNVITSTYETKADANLVSGRVTLLENANMVKSVSYEPLTHKITFTFYDNTTQLLDLPLESTIVGASYDNATKDITFTLQNNSTLIVPLDDLVSGLASETWVNTKLVDKADATHTHTKSEITDFPTSMPPTAHNHDNDYYKKSEVDLLVAGGGGGDVASLIEDLQDGRIIVGKATKDNGGSPLVQTYATSMDTSYDDINNKISIDLKNKEGNSLGTKIINLPLASYEKDGLLSAGEKNRIYNISNDISSAVSTHDSSATAHLPLRTLINDLQEEVDRLNAKGRSWGEIDKTFSELWAMTETNRNNYINTFLATAFSGYTPSNGDLVYTIVGAAEEEHELEYNSTFSQWVDNGVYNYDKASNTKHGIVKGDLTYVSILNGIIQVLKSDYATNIGSSGASYDYDDLQALSTGLAGKVSKVTTAGIAAYTKNGATQSTMNIDNASPTASTLVQRDTSGRIKASAGVANNDVVNVQQLNNALGETYSKAEVDALIVQELNNALGDIDSALDTLMGV